MPHQSNRIVSGITGQQKTLDSVESLKLMKSDFSIEIPAEMSTNGGKMFKTLALLCYATSTFEIHPVDEKDPIIGHPNEFPKEDDDIGWSKYLFNRKRIQTSNREYTVAHVVISASQSLNNMKRNKTVFETLKKDGIYIRAREFTNHNEKTAIGWLCGINPAMSGKENILKALKEHIVSHTSVVDTEIVVESTRIRQTLPTKNIVAHTTAWMIYGNPREADDIEICLREYLGRDEHEIALGVRNCKFVPAPRNKTDLSVKVIRIREHNKILNNTASIEINNIYPNDRIRYDENIKDLFDHFPEGDHDSLKVSFRDLLDEQLQQFIELNSASTPHDELIQSTTDYYAGVYDIYFHRGNFHIACKREFVNLVVRGMRTALEYLATHLETDELAHFCGIRKLNHWNYPKVGAVHTYDDTGVKRTTVDVNTPADMDVLEVEEFISEQGICYDRDFQHGWNVVGDPNKPPKALYHGRSKAPIRTTTASPKEGAKDFWKKLDLTTQKTAKKKPQKIAQRTAPARNLPVQVSQTETTHSMATSLTGNTELTAKIRDNKNELMKMINDMAERHEREMKAQEKKLDTAMNEMREQQATLTQGFAAMGQQNQEMIGTMREDMRLMSDGYKDGFSQLNNTLQAVLARLDFQQTAPGSPARPRKKQNLRLLSHQQANTLMHEADDLQIASDHSETDSQHPQTQDYNERSGSRGC